MSYELMPGVIRRGAFAPVPYWNRQGYDVAIPRILVASPQASVMPQNSVLHLLPGRIFYFQPRVFAGHPDWIDSTNPILLRSKKMTIVRVLIRAR